MWGGGILKRAVHERGNIQCAGMYSFASGSYLPEVPVMTPPAAGHGHLSAVGLLHIYGTVSYAMAAVHHPQAFSLLSPILLVNIKLLRVLALIQPKHGDVDKEHVRINRSSF